MSNVVYKFYSKKIEVPRAIWEDRFLLVRGGSAHTCQPRRPAVSKGKKMLGRTNMLVCDRKVGLLLRSQLGGTNLKLALLLDKKFKEK